MGLIEQAARRLEELHQAGVAIPWEAAGVTEEQVRRAAQASVAGERVGPAVRLAERHGVLPIRLARGTPALPSALATGAVPAPVARLQRAAEVVIDLDGLHGEGCLVPAMAGSPLADEFRSLTRPLLENALATAEGSEPSRSLVMVTSALPGEGKTFCAINLAMSLALQGEVSVLLVDADVVQPALLARLGLEAGAFKGLLDLLDDPALDPSEVMLRTNLPKLQLLPAGTPSATSAGKFASAAMAQRLGELARHEPDRLILFDSPPLLTTTEAGLLAGHMGQVVMVVAAADTASRDVRQAFAALEKCPLVLSVLNKCRDPLEQSAYGYPYR